MTLYQDFSSHFDMSKNMAAREQRLFSPLYKTLKIFLSETAGPISI